MSIIITTVPHFDVAARRGHVWILQSFIGDTLQMETSHFNEFGLHTEIAAAESCGRKWRAWHVPSEKQVRMVFE